MKCESCKSTNLMLINMSDAKGSVVIIPPDSEIVKRNIETNSRVEIYICKDCGYVRNKIDKNTNVDE